MAIGEEDAGVIICSSREILGFMALLSMLVGMFGAAELLYNLQLVKAGGDAGLSSFSGT